MARFTSSRMPAGSPPINSGCACCAPTTSPTRLPGASGTARDSTGSFADPERGGQADQCTPLARDEIGAQLVESVTYNTVLDRYVLLGLSADSLDGREVWGFYYAFSDDLVHWTHRELLAEMPLPWTVGDSGRDMSVLYPSLIDPDSTDPDFTTTDLQAYVYFTRHNAGQGSLDRDLVRVPVEFVLDS